MENGICNGRLFENIVTYGEKNNGGFIDIKGLKLSFSQDDYYQKQKKKKKMEKNICKTLLLFICYLKALVACQCISYNLCRINKQHSLCVLRS